VNEPICFVTHTNEPGGAEIALAHMLRSRRGSGDTLLDLSGSSTTQPGVRVVSFQLPLRLTLNSRRVGILSLLKLIPDALKYVFGLYKFFRDGRIKVVYLNSLRSGLLAGPPARLAGATVVWHLRDRLDATYLGSSARATAIRSIVSLTAHGVVANSDGTLAAAGMKVAAKPSLVSLSPVGPEFLTRSARTKAAHERQGAVGPDVVRFGVLARLAAWKGQDLVVRAIAELIREGHRVELDLAGGPLFGAEDFAAELRELVAGFGITADVRERGHVADVAGWLENVDVLVHYTRSPEPFGQGVVQALLAGVPVISSDWGGPAEIARRFEVPVTLVPPGRPADLLAAMRASTTTSKRTFSAGESRGLQDLRNAVDPELTKHSMARFIASLSGDTSIDS
jgi:glycosyltransferase involved in cell wall biosynthesis